MSYSILIPLYNEVSLIPTLLKDLNQLDNKYEIIIINDGSDDGSNNALKNSSNIILINNEKNYGKGFSIQKGIEVAKNDNIILMDGDLEVDTKDIPLLINEFESFGEIKKKAVVGVRLNYKNNINVKTMVIGNKLINQFFNKLFSTSFSDILCCYKVIAKENIQNFELKSTGFSIETEIMTKLVISNYIIKEVPVKYKPRTFSQGKKIKLIDGFYIFLTIINQKLKILFN